MGKFRIVEKEHWDKYWEKIDLPLEIKKNTSLLLDEILDVFDNYLPKGNLKVLEIGGAPGQYLIYLQKNFNYDIYVLEYSEVGCKKTRENFDLLDVPGVIYQMD